MKVSIDWLKELVDLQISVEGLIRLLPLRTIGLKEVTDNYIELDMKGYNRSDLLSLRGVAYETAATTDSPVLFKESYPEKFIWVNKGLPEASVKVENNQLAPLYCIAKISGLKVEPSPEEWVRKLASSGMRSVNNIADITNLVMLEYGQPTHAFDAEQVKDETIIVRCAKPGEKLVTLDNKTRNLLPTDLLITDPGKAVGLAGVMGGKNSEVIDSTNTILLEAAIFDPITIRKTASRLGLHSEASKRFQHGLTRTRLLQAVDAAAGMYQSLGGKLEAISIVGSEDESRPEINLSHDKLNSLVGVSFDSEFVQSALSKLGFQVTQSPKGWQVIPPYFRLDVSIEADIIEEVARMYGYENIPAKPLNADIPNVVQNPIFGLIERLKQTLVDLGLTEAQTYSYYSTQTINALRLTINNLIRIANPISSETEYLRDSLWPNLLEVTAKNLRNGIKDVAIFEVGKVYSAKKGELPKEEYHLSIALSNGTDNPIQELNQIAQNLKRVHLGGGLSRTPRETFHPNRRMDWIAEVHKRITDKFCINQRVAVLEIGLTKPQ